METLFGIAALTLVTIVGLFASLALQALLLRGAFALMQPAAAKPSAVRQPLVRGAQLTAQAYARR
jgi:hypothetical protein